MVELSFAPFIDLFAILVAAKISGEILARLGYPSVVGEIATGIILGPSVFGLILPQGSIGQFSDLGFALVLLYAGLTLDTKELHKAAKRGLFISVVNVTITISLGYLIGKHFAYPDLTSIALGVALSISSVGMGTRVLMDLGRLNTPPGITLLSGAVIDDVSGVLILAMVLGIASSENVAIANQIIMKIAQIALFFAVIFVVGFYTKIPEIIERRVQRSRTTGTKLTYVFASLFATMGMAHLAGIHGIIGAFFSGLILNKVYREDREIQRIILLMTLGLFAPIAYAWVGLNTNLATLSTNLLLLSSILAAGLGGKILGGTMGSRCTGFRWNESFVVGIGLTGRAGIELAVIEVMRSAGIIGSEVYSSIVVLTALACILMPFMLKVACTYFWRDSPLSNDG